MKTRNISFSQNIIDKVNNSVVSVVSKKKAFLQPVDTRMKPLQRRTADGF